MNSRILSAAQRGCETAIGRVSREPRRTVQDRGYGGLRFRELAKNVRIKSASIHHYFPTKGELGSALAARYTSDFLQYLDGLLAGGLDQKTCIKKYTAVFGQTVRNGSSRFSRSASPEAMTPSRAKRSRSSLRSKARN
jgi:AcrR family transcriptional regulator